MDDVSIKLKKLAGLARDALNHKDSYQRLIASAKKENNRNWARTTSGKNALAAEDLLFTSIRNSMELCSELLEKTGGAETLLQIIGQGSAKIIKFDNNKREKINGTGGIYETPTMENLRETNLDKTSSTNQKHTALVKYREELSKNVNNKYFSLNSQLVADYGDKAADILTPIITIFDANFKEKEKKRLDYNTKKRTANQVTQAKKDENWAFGKSKKWWYKKALEQMNGMGVTDCTNVGDGRSAEGLSFHKERKVWRYTDNKTDVELQDR